MAELSINGMQFFAFHGYYKEERKKGGNYTIDVSVILPDSSGDGDDLDSTLNYEKIYTICQEVMDESVYLIEYLCHKILNQLRATFPDVDLFTVKVTKHNPPLPGEVDSTSFELAG